MTALVFLVPTRKRGASPGEESEMLEYCKCYVSLEDVVDAEEA